MPYKVIKLFLSIFISGAGFSLDAQHSFYDINQIQKIEIQFSQNNWDFILDTGKSGKDQYLLAEYIRVNGFQLDSIGVKYKGSSSYDSTFRKNPLHIKIDKFKNNTYFGITDIKLANGYSDPSMIREALSYNILNKYMHSSRANFAMVFINGIYIGLYTNTEPVSKDFASEHFYSNSTNPMFKCSQVIASPYNKSSLKFISNDSMDYMPRYEMESKTGWNDFIRLCDTLTNFQSKMSSKIDIDRFLWMFAFNNALVNMDSYSGAFSQNYYVFKDNANHYNPIAWDLNMSFGAFPFIGSQGGGLGTLSLSQMQNLSAMLHSGDPDWPVLNYLLTNDSYKKRYLAHVKTILNENFVNGYYATMASKLQAMIDSALNADPNKFFSYAQFTNGLTGNVIFNSRTLPGIKVLMDARINALLTNDLAGVQPTISNIGTSVAQPIPFSTFSIKAQVLNTNLVNLFYRYSAGEKFKAILMYDDGMHNDGAANDKLFAANIVMSSGLCQYYIYAENTNTAILSPERAEHEFYTVSSTATKVGKGDVVINEFMASNATTVKDIAAEYDDWIEIYNTTANTINFTGWFLTDDYTNKTKWAFPNGLILGPNAYMIVWCDNEPAQGGIHSTFKLNISGEQIMLCQADSGVVDSVSFGIQKTDTSYARIPNGTGSFQYSIPTFNRGNYATGIKTNRLVGNNCIISPNPSTGIFNLSSTEPVYTYVRDIRGKEILVTDSKIIDLSRFDNGIYIFSVITNDQNIEIFKVRLFK